MRGLIAFARSPRRFGRERCRRSFLPIRFDLGRSFRTTSKIRKCGWAIQMILIKHNRRMKTLDRGWVVQSNFWLSQVGESGELRMKRSVIKLLPSATVQETPAEATKKWRALCASGLFKFVGVHLEKQVESVTQWGDAGHWLCAKFARYNRTHIPRPGCGCRLQADRPNRGALHWSGRLDQVVLDGADLTPEQD